jgi:hypothetical protein
MSNKGVVSYGFVLFSMKDLFIAPNEGDAGDERILSLLIKTLAGPDIEFYADYLRHVLLHVSRVMGLAETWGLALLLIIERWIRPHFTCTA